VSLRWVILVATLVAGLVPLALISWNSIDQYQSANQQATAIATKALDDKSISFLQVQTVQTADAIARFLDERVEDTTSAVLVPRTPEAYLTFYQAHTGQIWYPTGSKDGPKDRRDTVPLYREIAYIDADGLERLRVADGQVVPASALRNVRSPADTTYRTETYFNDTRALPAGEVYVSHLTAWHVSLDQQPAKSARQGGVVGSEFGQYLGVIRFATPVFTADGRFDGIVLLSLDHRHIMEQTIHSYPTSEQPVVWPDYVSGNYGQVWDDEGYTIVHPVLARMRGLDARGNVISPLTNDMSDAEKALHTFNMLAGNDPAPQGYAATVRGERLYASNRNQAGTLKANYYVPIPFRHGVYAKSGVFGGIAISANIEDFHRAASTLRANFGTEQARLTSRLLTLSLVAVVLLAVTSTFIARNVTRPVHRLTEAAELMEKGELDTDTLNSLLRRRILDEVTILAQVFKKMAEQVQLRERKLKEQIVELRIEIDEAKKASQVNEIVESDYFKNLRASAQTMRGRVKGVKSGDGAPV
jgi:HAMP domain-containing protein